MPVDPRETTYYKQARFSTRLPNSFRYSPSHYWIAQPEPGVLRVGMTKFATRMLGDFVEFTFLPPPGVTVKVGEPIGTIEGFKAVSDIYSAVAGEFLRVNSAVEQQPDLVDTDPYDRGWLFEVKGELDEQLLDVDGYINVLQATIERMLAETDKAEDRNC